MRPHQALDRAFRSIRYFHRSGGVRAVWAELWRKLLSPVYRRETAQLRVMDMGSPAAEKLLAQPSPSGIECTVIESVDEWRRLAVELPRVFRYSSYDIEARLGEGYRVFLARLHTTVDGAGGEIVGYSLAERGVVVAFGEKRQVGPDLLFTHFTEVHPAHRGRRVQTELARQRALYCRRHGIAKRCTWVGGRNRPALVALARSGGDQAAELKELSILGGLYRRHTRWEEIERAIGSSAPRS